MKSRTTSQFRRQLQQLPEEIRARARDAYLLFRHNPWHPSLSFKQIHPTLPIYSVRIGKHYRAVGKWDQRGVLWIWIGSHAQYDELVKWK